MSPEEYYRTIFVKSHDIILIADMDGHILEVNPAATGRRQLVLLLGDNRNSHFSAFLGAFLAAGSLALLSLLSGLYLPSL